MDVCSYHLLCLVQEINIIAMFPITGVKRKLKLWKKWNKYISRTMQGWKEKHYVFANAECTTFVLWF